MIKMIVCDLDGTLLDRNKEVLQKNIDVLKAAQEKGVVLVLASGRNVFGMEHIYQQLGMDVYKTGYIVGVNGMQRYRFRDEQLLQEKSLSFNEVKNIKAVAKKLGYIVFTLQQDASYISGGAWVEWLMKNSYVKKKLFSHGYDGRLPSPRFSPYEESFENVTKVCVQSLLFHLTNDKKIKSLLPNYEVMSVSPGWFEIMPFGLNKAQGVTSIMEELHISVDEVLIFGDSENDIEMLRLTNNSYVMASGMKSAKAVAKHETTNHNLPGIGEVVEQYLVHNK